MSGWWLVSYVALWVLVMAACVLLVGMVRHTALAHSADEAAIARKRARPQDTPAIEDDGPTIGSTLPQVVASSINGHGDVDLADAQGRQTLLMFLSSVCESCQHIIEPLNGALAARPDTLRIIAIMKADENGCRAFNALFPLNGPMLCMDKLIGKLGEPLARPRSRASFLGLMGKGALGLVAAVVGGGAGLTLERSAMTAFAESDQRCCPGNAPGNYSVPCPLEFCPSGSTSTFEGICCVAFDCVHKEVNCYNCFYVDDPARYFCSYSVQTTVTCHC